MSVQQKLPVFHLLLFNLNNELQTEQRLKELRYEFGSGQKALAELDNKQAEMRITLLRISGAINPESQVKNENTK
jgi:hypothetical protein